MRTLTYEALVAQLDLRLEEGEPPPDGPLVVQHALTLDGATLGPPLTCALPRWSPDWQLACELAVTGSAPPTVWWGGVAGTVVEGALRFAPMPRSATGRLATKPPGAPVRGLLSALAGPQEVPADVWGSGSQVDELLLVAEPPFEPPLTPPPGAAPPGAGAIDSPVGSHRAALRHEPGPVTPADAAQEVRAQVERQSAPLLACYAVARRVAAAGAYVGQVEVSQDGSPPR